MMRWMLWRLAGGGVLAVLLVVAGPEPGWRTWGTLACAFVYGVLNFVEGRRPR